MSIDEFRIVPIHLKLTTNRFIFDSIRIIDWFVVSFDVIYVCTVIYKNAISEIVAHFISIIIVLFIVLLL